MEGWISLHRKMIDWEWYNEPNTLRLFLHCLLKANHSDKKWRGQDVKRGSFITSYGKLADELELSVQNIRTAISNLKLTGELTSESTSKHTVIQLVKYEEYQSANKPTNNQTTNNQQASNKQLTTTNNDNKENNDNNDNKNKSANAEKKQEYEFLFGVFWDKYNKKVDRHKCLLKWNRLTEKEIEQVFQHVEKYVESTPDKQFRKNPLSYLNAKSFQNEIIDKTATVNEKKSVSTRYREAWEKAQQNGGSTFDPSQY